MLIEMDNANIGGGTLEVKQVTTDTLASTGWQPISGITADGILSLVCVDNFNLQWRNQNKGTTGSFTDISVYNCGYASISVSAGDTVEVYLNTSTTRHFVGQVIGVA